MALGLTKPLTEMNTTVSPEGGRGEGEPVLVADNLAKFVCRLSRYFGSLNLLKYYGPVQACVRIALSLLFTHKF